MYRLLSKSSALIVLNSTENRFEKDQKTIRNGHVGNLHLSIQEHCPSAAWVITGLLPQHSGLTEQLHLQTGISCSADGDFLPVVQAVSCFQR